MTGLWGTGGGALAGRKGELEESLVLGATFTDDGAAGESDSGIMLNG
jgi:hypothetical protein